MANFNDFNINPKGKSTRLIFFVIVAFLVFILLSFFAIKWIFPLIKELTTANIIAIFALLIASFSLVFTVGKYTYELSLSAKKSIHLSVTVQGKNAIIKCSIENNGQKRFVPQSVVAFVESGFKNDQNKQYEFPFLLKHEKDDCDCSLSKICKQGGVVAYPSEMVDDSKKNLYHKVFKFQHLSHEAILYIDPNEKFNDSIVLNLDAGVYRVMVIATIVKGDCICSTENFVIL
jgi:hypothetical protein